jgi:hypothetical protein
MGLIVADWNSIFRVATAAQTGQEDLPHLFIRGRFAGPSLGFFPATTARWEQEEHVFLQ